MTENNRLTNSDKEIPTLNDNAEYWLQVYFKLKDYEAIGTIEEFKALKNKHIGKDNMVISSSDLMTILNSDSEELKQYKEVGTVEEFKALKEKNTPYKPKEYEDRYYACKCGNPLLHKWDEYPTKLMPKTRGLSYCLNCGQKIDWSE